MPRPPPFCTGCGPPLGGTVPVARAAPTLEACAGGTSTQLPFLPLPCPYPGFSGSALHRAGWARRSLPRRGRGLTAGLAGTTPSQQGSESGNVGPGGPRSALQVAGARVGLQFRLHCQSLVPAASQS